MSEGIVNSFCRVTEERRNLEWLRENTSRNEAQALWNAERKRDEHWQGVIAEIDTAIAEIDTAIAEIDTAIAAIMEMDATPAQKDEALANQAAIITKLRAKLRDIHPNA